MSCLNYPCFVLTQAPSEGDPERSIRESIEVALTHNSSLPTVTTAEMRLNGDDVWLHAAPLFHLVDVFAVYAVTLVGGRHVLMPLFAAQGALLTMGKGQRKMLPKMARESGALLLMRKGDVGSKCSLMHHPASPNVAANRGSCCSGP